MLSDWVFFNQGGDNVEDTGKWAQTEEVDEEEGRTKDKGDSQRAGTLVAAGSVWSGLKLGAALWQNTRQDWMSQFSLLGRTWAAESKAEGAEPRWNTHKSCWVQIAY